jgi:hypothetical protein
MQPIWINVAALAVAAIYYWYRAYDQARQRQQRRLLRERVAYMLWVAAEQVACPVGAGGAAVP